MVAQTKAVARGEKIATQQKALVKWKGELITVTFHDVKTLICPYASDQETAVFLKTCQALNLNPFAGEIYLIKYSEEDKAATVISINSYLKAAETNESYNGCEAGVIVKDGTGKLDFRDYAFLLDEEMGGLVGGWAKVYRKDRERPSYIAVNKTECIRYTKSGKPTRFWAREKQPSMLRKVALKRALVEAFPSLFAGTLATAEVGDDAIEAEYEVAEGELPPAMEKGGQPDWKKFWARVKSELGLTTEEARELLKVDSIKEELIDAGWTMEKIWEELVNALQQQKATEVEPEPSGGVATPTKIKPKQADWRAFWEHADQLGLSHKQVCEMLGVGSVVEWTDQGKTLDEAIEVVSKKLGKPKAARAKPAKAQPAPVIDVTPEPEEDLFPPDEVTAVTPEPDESPPAKPRRDPETIRTINELYKACHEDWGMQPKDVLKELGVSSQSDLSDTPANCYRQIAAVR